MNFPLEFIPSFRPEVKRMGFFLITTTFITWWLTMCCQAKYASMFKISNPAMITYIVASHFFHLLFSVFTFGSSMTVLSIILFQTSSDWMFFFMTTAFITSFDNWQWLVKLYTSMSRFLILEITRMTDSLVIHFFTSFFCMPLTVVWQCCQWPSLHLLTLHWWNS